jgi:hypothetical protein
MGAEGTRLSRGVTTMSTSQPSRVSIRMIRSTDTSR